MNVSSVELEGEYICEFELEEEGSFAGKTFVTIMGKTSQVTTSAPPLQACSLAASFTARPATHIRVDAETVNGTHYQSVSCSAVGGRPPPQIRWLIRGLPVTDRHPFSVDTSTAAHWNGTSTLSSVLRFPTRLQDDDSVTCEVQHPTLPRSELTTVRVETYGTVALRARVSALLQGGDALSCIQSPFCNQAS